MPQTLPGNDDIDAFYDSMLLLRDEAQRRHTVNLTGRAIKKLCSRSVSHVTIHEMMSRRRVPSWPVVAEVVGALGGIQHHYAELWRRAWLAYTESKRTTASVSPGEPWVYELEICELTELAKVCTEREAEGWQLFTVSHPPAAVFSAAFSVPTAALFRAYARKGTEE